MAKLRIDITEHGTLCLNQSDFFDLFKIKKTCKRIRKKRLKKALFAMIESQLKYKE